MIKNIYHLKLLTKGLTQAELAKVLETDQSCVSRLLIGKRKLTIDMALRLSKRLNINLITMLKDLGYRA